MVRVPNELAKNVSLYWVVAKWSLMAAAVFWMSVYQLSDHAARMPEFVYVNF